MKYSGNKNLCCIVSWLFSLFVLVFSSSLSAGNLSISQEPLGTGTGVSVRPNLAIILDDSGSMAQSYTPDYVNTAICSDNNASGSLDDCDIGDPPYASAGFNKQFYNPSIRYLPPVGGGGVSWADATPTAAPTEAFNSYTNGSASSTTDLTTKVQDVFWCKTSSSSVTSTDCKKIKAGEGYIYPDATYKYKRTGTSSSYLGSPYYFLMNGSPIWCSNTALTTCQVRRTGTYKYPRFSAVTTAAVVGIKATMTISVGASTTAGSITSINVTDSAGVVTTLSSTTITFPRTDGSSRVTARNTLAGNIVSAINSSGAGYTAVITTAASGNNGAAVITVSSPTESDIYNGVYVLNFIKTGGSLTFSNSGQFRNGVTPKPAQTIGGVVFSKVIIQSGVNSYAVDPGTSQKYSGRSDCVATTSCTYTEELQNYANWYSFYRYRMLMMKTALSRVLSNVSETSPGNGFRVGLMTIGSGASSSKASAYGDTTNWKWNKDKEVEVQDFNASHKATFYNNLFSMREYSYTPLRGALSRAGKLYSGKLSYDPVKFACQQNFSLLSTDGYWNSQYEDTSYGPQKEDGSNVGDQDADATKYNRPAFDGVPKSDTLADVALYYYKTDIRPDMNNEVADSPSDSMIFTKAYRDAQSATYKYRQRMVTFTLGLGVDGTLIYNSNYETGGSSDYNEIIAGTKNWPSPWDTADGVEVDDLWHAAVSGGGKYLSAGTPEAVYTQILEALNSIAAQTGSSAAAATSKLQLVVGKTNLAYLPLYRTQDWWGDLEGWSLDANTGALATERTWSARDQLNSVAAGSGRVLYVFDPTSVTVDKKRVLSWANLTADEKAYFNPTRVSQCTTLSACPGATSENLFDYLMGKIDATTGKSYRRREYVLGDIVNSAPVPVGAPYFNYIENDYSQFKDDNKNRREMVYVGANDGFLHAFDASNGAEKWAYMPLEFLSQVYQLANSPYSHRYFLDGKVTAGDVYSNVSGDTGWKTILVGGVGGGGKHYFALDVTDPDSPKAMWEFTDATMGYSYGNPIITKLPEGSTSGTGANIAGKWVVLLTSGYNGGDAGQGVLYVLDALSGVEYFRIKTTATGVTASNPVGLAKINNWREHTAVSVDDGIENNNTTLYVYGGDLDGSLWRFTLSDKSVSKVAAVAEPITVMPELALVENKHRVIYFGTGLFIQLDDKSDRTIRSIYAVKDDGSSSTLSNLKSSGDLVEQTLSLSGSKRQNTSVASIDWETKYGWYSTLLLDGERVNIDPQIVGTQLIVASNIPDEGEATDCSSGGKSWVNAFDYKSGAINSTDTQFFGNTLIVGVTSYYTADGKEKILVVGSDGSRKDLNLSGGGTPSGVSSRRLTWRELLSE